MKGKERFEEIDVLKALGIICVVLGHSGAPGTKFIYMFHMPIFFMASGYVYSSRHSESFQSVIKSIKSKISRLWFPYFFWNSLFILLNNLFIKINFYTTNSAIYEYVQDTKRANLTALQHYMDIPEMLTRIAKSAFFRSPTAMGGAMWFLGTLFIISVGYLILDWLIRKCLRSDPWVIQTVISVVFLILGVYCQRRGIVRFGLNRVFSCYILYHLGCSLKKGNILALFKTQKQHFMLGGCSLLVLLMMYQLRPGYSIDLWSNYYPDPVFLILASLAGWGLVYSISHFVKDSPLKKGLLFIGSRTMSITILHYLFFKIIAFMVVNVYQVPIFCMAAHSHLYGDRGIWWLAYTVAGVAGPILLYQVYKKAQKKILSFRKERLPL